jgi:hypothetical protein
MKGGQKRSSKRVASEAPTGVQSQTQRTDFNETMAGAVVACGFLFWITTILT